MVLDSWIAEYYWSDHKPAKPCDPSSGVGSVGVLINGEDNYVQNVIIFDFTCLGVLVNGAASLLDGVRCSVPPPPPRIEDANQIVTQFALRLCRETRCRILMLRGRPMM